MAENEKAGGQPASALLHDMGRSEARHAAGYPSEDQPMRFAGDPLGMRDFLRRQEFPRHAPLTVPVLAGETAIALSREAIGRGTGRSSSNQVRYPSPEPLEEASIFPRAFNPSRDDQVGALDHEPRFLGHSIASAGPLGRSVLRWIGLTTGFLLLTFVMLAF